MTKNKNFIPAPKTIELLRKLEEHLSSRDTEAYIVGGFVRDLLLGRQPVDIDIAVKADAQEIAAGVAEIFGGKHITLDEKNGIARVILLGDENPFSGMIIDFSAYASTIKKDLARRDFTINAMALPLAGFEKAMAERNIIDPLEGQDDLNKKIVNATGENVYIMDPARLLRAVRHMAELGFSIDPETEDLLKEDAHLIFDVPGERIREELMRLILLPGSGKILRYLDRLGLLTSIFPELEESRGVEQPKEHYWDVFEHSLATVEALEFLLDEGPWDYASADIRKSVPLTPEIRKHLDEEVSAGSTRKSLLKLSALLHDTGKPGTQMIDENGRMRFFGHGPEGAELVTAMLENLRFSKKEINVIETEIVHHMRPTQMSNEGMPTDRAIYRYFRDTGECGLDILFLNLADHLAVRGPELDIEGWREHTSLIEYVVKKNSEKENIRNTPKLLDGYDIMKSFGLGAGPVLGEVLEAVHEAQAVGEIHSRQEALSLVENILQAREHSGEEK